jgi:hypothetical protein
MKRFMKALPVILVGGLALTGCSATETPAAETSFALEYTTHAEGDALGDALNTGANVLGNNAVTASAQLASLGLVQRTVDVSSANSTQKQSAELTLEGVTADSITAAKKASAEFVASILTQWQSGDTSKTEEAFFADESVKSYFDGYPGVALAEALPALTETEGTHTATFAPRLLDVLKKYNATLTLTVPGSATLEGTPAGVSVSGHEVTIDPAQLKAGESVAVSYHDAAPMMSWWLSLVLWVLGVIVTVLLIMIALAPRRRD